MRLDDWLKASGLTETDFGDRVRLSQPQVNRLRRGESGTSWDTANRIVRVTGGGVTLADLGYGAEAAE